MNTFRNILAGLALTAPMLADEIRLIDGSILDGEVLSHDGSSQLQLASPLSTEPLLLHSSRITKTTFASTKTSYRKHDAKLTLINGDELPCDLTEIDDKQVSLNSQITGPMTIDRKWIGSIQMGLSPAKTLFQGPSKDEPWELGENWEQTEDSLISHAASAAGREFEPIEDPYSLSFELSWVQPPNLTVYFCSETLAPGGGNQDRYMLKFNNSGIVLKRQSSNQTTDHTIGTIERKPSSFLEDRVHFELRISRQSRSIDLLLDGEPAGHFGDPVTPAPKESSIVFQSNLNVAEGHRVSNIAIREWHAERTRHHSNDRGESPGDALIDHEGDRFSGSLLGTAERDNRQVILFRIPHYEDPLEIPRNKVSTLFMSQPGKNQATPNYTLTVPDGGQLSASQCQIDKDTATLTHPLLGEILIQREALRSFSHKASERAPSEEAP